MIAEAKEIATYTQETEFEIIKNADDESKIPFSRLRNWTELFKNIQENENYVYSVDSDLKLYLLFIKNHGETLLQSQKRKSLLQRQLPFHNSEIDTIISEISSLDFEDAIVEGSINDSLIFKLKFLPDTILIINIPVENIGSISPNAVFTLLENGETIVRNYNSLENIVAGMQAYFAE